MEVYKEMIHPLVNGIIISVFCGLVDFFIPKEHIVFTLILKASIALIVTYIVVSLYGDYDINALIRKSLAKFRIVIHK